MPAARFEDPLDLFGSELGHVGVRNRKRLRFGSDLGFAARGFVPGMNASLPARGVTSIDRRGTRPDFAVRIRGMIKVRVETAKSASAILHTSRRVYPGGPAG